MKKVLVFAIVMVLASSAFAAGAPIPTTGPTTAQLPADMQMITSAKALMSYAKERVVEAAANGWSNGVNLPGGTPYVSVASSNPDIRVITQLLAKQALSFNIGDLKSLVYLEAALFDDERYTLFVGQNQFNLVNGPGGWTLPAGAANIVMKLNSEVPIYVPGVSYAYVEVSNGDGTYQYVWIQTSGDRIMFPTSLCGFSGQLVLNVGQNTAAFDMNTGASVPPTPVSAQVQASIEGLITLDNPMEIVFGSFGKAGGSIAVENPLYQASFFSPKTVSLYAVAPNGEVATSVVVRKVGDPTPTVYPIESGGSMTQLDFESGVYDVWFVFPSFGNDEPFIPPYYNGGGMG